MREREREREKERERFPLLPTMAPLEVEPHKKWILAKTQGHLGQMEYSLLGKYG